MKEKSRLLIIHSTLIEMWYKYIQTKHNCLWRFKHIHYTENWKEIWFNAKVKASVCMMFWWVHC